MSMVLVQTSADTPPPPHGPIFGEKMDIFGKLLCLFALNMFKTK